MVFPFFYDDALYYLEFAEEHWCLTNGLKNQMLILRQNLRFLRTYLLCMELLKKVSLISFSRSKPLISNIEAASSEAAQCLYKALSVTRTIQGLASAVSFIANKVKCFEPNIQEDYTLLLNQHSWDSSSSNYSSLHPARLTDLCDFVINNLDDLLESKNLILSLKKQMEVLVKKLKFLKNLISDTSWRDDARQVMGSFMQYVPSVTKVAACLSYLCWVGETNYRYKAREVEIKLSDLLQKFKTDTAELIEMHVTLLSASAKEKSGDGKREALNFVNFLMENSVSFMNDQNVIIFEEMVFLMEFVIKPQTYPITRDYYQISADIKATAKEVGCFEYNFLVNKATEDQLRDMNRMFASLLEKMKLIKAEIFLIQLQDSQESFIATSKARMIGLHQSLGFLRSFLSDPLEKEEEDIKQLSKDAATMAREITALIHLMHEKKVTKETVREVNLEIFLLLEKIKLIEGELYLMRLKDQKAEFIAPINDQIITLHEGLKYFREFLMDPSKMEEDTEDGKLFLKHFEAVTKESSSFILSFWSDENANEAIDEANFQLLKLLDKINLVKAEIFLAELQSHDASWMIDMKDPVQTLQKVQEGVRFLRIVLLESPKEFKEFGEQIWMKLEALAKEVTCLVFLLGDNLTKEDMSKEMNRSLSDLIDKIVLLKAEIGQIYLQIPQPYPKTDDLGFLSSFLGNLRELLDCNAISIASAKHQLDMVYMDLDFLISFLIKSVKQHHDHEELKVLRTRITKIAYELEYAVDSFVVGDGPLCIRMLWLSAVIEEIKLLKANMIEISDEKRFDSEADRGAETSSEAQSQASSPTVDEVVIGFEDAERGVVDRLTRGTMERDIIPIVGMAGLGKTTLAKEVFNNPTVTSHFYVRAWCCISQVYNKRQLLLDILSQISETTDQIQKKDAEDVALELRKRLKRRRYLIVMDDLWDIEAWNDLRDSFPNDNNGSRVLFTSRLEDVAFKAKSGCKPYFLHLLSGIQSWELLELKLFGQEGCPPSLQQVGMEIARKCDGLPLSVVVIAGLLATTEKTPLSWEQVSRNLSSHIVTDPQMGCLRVLELSYLHLPDYLKRCFLYFAAFPEDHEIPVSKLSRLWIAEGFLQETGVKRLEDAAEDCLLDLIHRSLVIVAKTRSDGRVRSCRIHDLLRKLCQRKAQEENFFQLVHGYDEHFATTPDGKVYNLADSRCSFSTNPLKYKQRRLCICSEREHFTMLRPCGPRVHSLLFLAYNDWFPRCPYDISFISKNFRLLRVLDLESINMGSSFPTGLELLVQLRYLALRGAVNSVPTSIAKLRKLETFLLKGLSGEVEIPDAFWEMESLRHVHINDRAAFILDDNKLETRCVLGNLDTLSTPVLRPGRATEKIMRRLPKLRKLRCIFMESWNFPVLDVLTSLESLKIFYHGRVAYPCKFSFPANLKKLTLSKFRLPWTEISTIGRLPNLESLKLLFKAFEGRVWETREGEFQNLKYLKLDKLDIAQWEASNDHFPSLEQLVLQRCTQLEEVPLSFGEIPTLQIIEVHWCAEAAAVSVKKIEEEQRDSGNEELKVLISGLEI